MNISDLSREETVKVKMKISKIISNTVSGYKPGLYEELKDVLLPYWFPLSEVNDDTDVIAFDIGFMNEENNLERLRRIFADKNINEVLESQELSNAKLIEGFSDEEYFLEEDEDGLSNFYMSECFWLDQSEEWLMYASHEATIAFWGTWLVQAIKKEFKEFEQYEIK